MIRRPPRATLFPYAKLVRSVGMLRGRGDRRHRFGLLIPLTFAAVLTPVQIGVGDWIANTVADNQPAKLAAMEGQYETTADRKSTRLNSSHANISYAVFCLKK